MPTRHTLPVILAFLAYGVSVVCVLGVTVQTPFLLVLGALLLRIAYIDSQTLAIPNRHVVLCCVNWLVMVFAMYVTGYESTPDPFVSAFMPNIVDNSAMFHAMCGLLAAFATAASILLIVMVFSKLTGKQGMGLGDVKLYFAASLYLGPSVSLLNCILSCVLGLTYAITKRKQEEFPFGPFISLSTSLSLLFGSPLVTAYLSLF